MKRMMVLVALTLLHLATTPALAESAGRCGQADQRCAVKTEAVKKPTRSDTREQVRKAPKVGQVMKDGRALKTAEARKLAKPATGRAYRVMEDRVVLVDAKTMKIVQVLGLASEILR